VNIVFSSESGMEEGSSGTSEENTSWRETVKKHLREEEEEEEEEEGSEQESSDGECLHIELLLNQYLM